MKIKLPKRGSKYEMKPSKEYLEQASKDIDSFLKDELPKRFIVGPNGIILEVK